MPKKGWLQQQGVSQEKAETGFQEAPAVPTCH
jgi:hypothetical protein